MVKKISWRSSLDVVTSVVLIGVAVAVLWVQLSGRRAARSEPPVPREPLSTAGVPIKGSASATTVVIVFSDFQCPYCGKFATEVLPELEREYINDGRVQLAFRHLPLKMHQFAVGAAHASECGRDQGRFWRMHDELFRAGGRFNDKTFLELAQEQGLDMSAFSACMRDAAKLNAINRDLKLAESLNLRSTPVFLIGSKLADDQVSIRRVLVGALPMPQFRKEIESIISGKGAGLFTRVFG